MTVDSNQIIYKCLEKVLTDNPNTKPDLPLILSAANSLGFKEFFEKNDERKHLRAVMNMPVELDNASTLAAKIAKLEIARNLRRKLKECAISLQSITGDEHI